MPSLQPRGMAEGHNLAAAVSRLRSAAGAARKRRTAKASLSVGPAGVCPRAGGDRNERIKTRSWVKFA